MSDRPFTHSAEESSSSPRGDGGLESELLVRSACPGADMALIAAKSLQTTGQMCFIWALSVDTSCLRCMRGQHYTAAPKAEAETPDWNLNYNQELFPSALPSHTTVSNITPHEEAKYLKLCLLTKASVSTEKNVEIYNRSGWEVKCLATQTSTEVVLSVCCPVWWSKIKNRLMIPSHFIQCHHQVAIRVFFFNEPRMNERTSWWISMKICRLSGSTESWRSWRLCHFSFRARVSNFLKIPHWKETHFFSNLLIIIWSSCFLNTVKVSPRNAQSQ